MVTRTDVQEQVRMWRRWFDGFGGVAGLHADQLTNQAGLVMAAAVDREYARMANELAEFGIMAHGAREVVHRSRLSGYEKREFESRVYRVKDSLAKAVEAILVQQ